MHPTTGWLLYQIPVQSGLVQCREISRAEAVAAAEAVARDRTDPTVRSGLVLRREISRAEAVAAVAAAQ